MYGGKVRWNRGQEECARCGWWLIRLFHPKGTHHRNIRSHLDLNFGLFN